MFWCLWWSSISEPKWQRDRVQQCTSCNRTWTCISRYQELVLFHWATQPQQFINFPCSLFNKWACNRACNNLQQKTMHPREDQTNRTTWQGREMMTDEAKTYLKSNQKKVWLRQDLNLHPPWQDSNLQSPVFRPGLSHDKYHGLELYHWATQPQDFGRFFVQYAE